MSKKWVLFSVLLLLCSPFVLASGEQTFWQQYSWYIIGAASILVVYILFRITKKLVIVGLLLVAAAILFNMYLVQNTPEVGVVGDIHYHADFAMYVNGERYNFSQEKYMSTENKTLSNFAHLHDMNGNIIHKHASGITLGFFLETLGMKLTDTCLTMDDGTEYCNSGNKLLKLYVNDKPNTNFDNYNLQDEDRILLSYGSESEKEIEKQLDSVSDAACIYSLTCPEKGAPPAEASCVGDTCTVEG
ncbi:MAG TPA: hypothetical protein VJB13_03530 [Candidatus Nanoarchaeia archaeon]|nr:hypothetical protein [Candidatus Nanoarchaeia archaeon]